MNKILKILGKMILIIVILITIYILTLCFPEPFFKNKFTIENITVYSDEEIPTEINEIVKTAENRIKKSAIYKENLKPRIFIANGYWRWRYFSNINHKAGGLAYVGMDNIFFRKVDIKNNRLYGNSGKVAAGDRTLDYFMAHEMTHLLEFKSMPWYKYPFKTNWILEGYCDYVAHGSKSYEEYLNHYLSVPENAGAKFYSRARTMVAYLIEKEKMDIYDIWNKTNDYDLIFKMTIPDDRPNIVN